MALFARAHVWVTNEVLKSTDLNTEFNNILNNAQASSWIGYSTNVTQMQTTATPGGVGTESLASSIADELARLRFMFGYALGKTQWYDQTGRNFGAGNLAVLTADLTSNCVSTSAIANNGVTSPKIAAGSVGAAQKGALNSNSSSGTGNFTGTATTSTGINGGTVMLTASGLRPVWVGLTVADATNLSYVGASGSGTSPSARLIITRDGIVLCTFAVAASAGSGPVSAEIPPGAVQTIDSPNAAVHTYQLNYFSLANTTTTQVNYVQLTAYEL